MFLASVDAAKRIQPALGATSGARYEPTIIEMFGLPGAGKTTLATAVIEDGPQLTRRDLTAAWNRLSLRQRTAFLLRALGNARCLGCAARFALRSRLTSFDSLARLLRLVAKTSWMRSHHGEMLLDQSFLQEIWSICISAGRSDPDPVALAQFISCLYAGLPTQIVFLEADAAIASLRLSGRNHGHSRLDGLAAATVETHLARTARLPHAIVAAAMAAGLPVKRLDGADPVETNADRLRKMLMATPYGQDSD
jgi:hypothetical protein